MQTLNNTQNLISTLRASKLACGLVSVFVLLLLSDQAWAQFGSPVSVSVTNHNGWVVVMGRAGGKLIWQRPLAPFNNQGISLSQGTNVAVVAIGSRVYQLDNDTGASFELGVRPLTAPPSESVGDQWYPNNLPPSRNYAPMARARATITAMPMARLAPTSQPELDDPLARLTPAERQLLASDRNLMATLYTAKARLNNAQQFLEWVSQYGEQYAGELNQANATLGAARQQLATARRSVVEQLEARSSANSVPASQPSAELVRKTNLQRNALNHNMALIRKLQDVASLTESRADQDLIDKAEQEADRLRIELMIMNSELEQLANVKN